MSQEEEVSAVGDHNEKMAMERDPEYGSEYKEDGAGNAEEACFQTNIEENSLGDGTPTPNKQLYPICMGRVCVDKNNDQITVKEIRYDDDGFLYLNGTKFYVTGPPKYLCWRCNNIWCDAYIVITTMDLKTADFILERCRFKHSERCIEHEEEKARQKESQSLLLNNLSPEAPGSLEETQACINQRNSHGSHSTNTLDSKADEQIKDDEDVPKEIAPLLKNDSLCRITPTDDFNEPQPPTELSEKPLKDSSNTNSDSNISTSTQTYASILILIGLIIWIFIFIILLLHGNGFNLMLYSPMINRFTRISNRQKLSKFKANDFNASAFGRDTALKSTITSSTQK